LARRTAKFACAILAGFIGSALLTLLPRIPAAVADDCLTAPTGDKADGQHWRYRLERGRRCWYLKDSTAATQNNADDTTPRQATQPSSAWDFAQPAPPKLTPRRSNGPAPRASTEALAADDAKPAARPQPAATPSLIRTQPAASFDDSLQRSATTPSWQPLDSADMDSTAAAPAAAASTVPDEPAPAPDPAASASTTADAAVATPAKPAKPVAPIRKLLMVVVGALSLSGLLASALYRLSKVGRRRRRNRNWQRAVARVRRNRDKPRSKSKVVHAGTRSAKRPTMAPAAKRAAPPEPMVAVEPKPAVALRAAPPAPVVAIEPIPTVATAPAAVDPAAELVDLLASRAAKVAPPPAAATPARAAEPMPASTASAPSQAADPAAELVGLLGSHAARRAAQQPFVEAPASPTPPPLETASPRLPLVADPAAELANLLESRFVPPPAPPARAVAAHARPQPPAVPVKAAPPSVVDPISELASLLEAKESERAARLGGTDAPGRSNRPASTPPAARPVDPAAELFDTLEARAARTPPPPAHVAQPVKAVQPPRLKPSTPDPVNTAPPVKPVQPSSGTAPRRKKAAPPVRVDSAPVSRVQVPAEPLAPAKANDVRVAAARAEPRDGNTSRTEHPGTRTSKVATPKIATSKPGKSARRPADGGAPRRKDTELPPLPPALLLEPENNGPEPPLDFIPRPQALRPRMRDIRQDESLDGVQDILARLAKHG
jgi:hypothetical protein